MTLHRKPASTAARDPGAHSAQPRVLVVEDEQDIAALNFFVADGFALLIHSEHGRIVHSVPGVLALLAEPGDIVGVPMFDASSWTGR